MNKGYAITEIIPCDNCICVAMCRLKRFGKLYEDCQLLRVYFRDTIKDGRQYGYLKRALKVEEI